MCEERLGFNVRCNCKQDVHHRAEDPGALDVEDGVPPPRAAPPLLRRVVLRFLLSACQTSEVVLVPIVNKKPQKIQQLKRHLILWLQGSALSEYLLFLLIIK